MKTIHTLLNYAIGKERRLLPYSILYTICTGLSSLLSILFLQTITRVVENTQMQSTNLSAILLCTCFAGGIILTKTVSSIMYFKADSRFTFIRTDLQNDVNYRIMKLDFELIEDNKFLEKNKRALKSLESSEHGTELILKTIFQLPGLVLSLLSAFFFLAAIRCYLPLLSIPYLLIGLWTSRKYALFQESLQYEASQNQIQMDYLFDTVNDTKYAKELRIFHLRQLFFHKLSDRLNCLSSLMRKEEHFMFRAHIAASLALFLLSSTAVMSIVCVHYRTNTISLSQLVAAIYAVISIWQFSNELFEQTGKIIFESKCVNEIFDMLNTEYLVSEPESFFLSDSYEYEWDIKNLTFQYPNSNEYALQNISFKLRPHEHLAVVGLNGAGKSTLIKCMTGLYKNYKGQIIFRGQDIRNLPADILSQYIGVQHQDADIYPFTIKENMTSSCPDSDPDKLWDSLSAVFTKDTLQKFSAKTNTILEKLFDENGVVLSGGEREAFLFARILYKNPASIILDEPTAKLDAIAEQKIIALLKNTFSDKCVIFVSHHLDITASMNRILLLKDGMLIGDGSHQNLLQHCNEYRRLIDLQKQYYYDGGVCHAQSHC